MSKPVFRLEKWKSELKKTFINKLGKEKGLEKYADFLRMPVKWQKRYFVRLEKGILLAQRKGKA